MKILIIGTACLVGSALLLWVAGLTRQHFSVRRARGRFWANAKVGSAYSDDFKDGFSDSELPPIVCRYLSRALSTGVSLPRQIELVQSGEIRLGRGKPWSKLSAKQLISAHPPSFVWWAKTESTTPLTFHVLDTFDGRRGRFSGALAGLVKVAGSTGPEVDVSSLLRYLAEAVWLPRALVPSDSVRWTSMASPLSARVVMSCGALRVSGVFTFDAQARPVEFFTSERFRDVNGEPVRTDWRVEYRRHRQLHNVEVPREGVVSWILDDGPLDVLRLRVERVTDLSGGYGSSSG